MGGACAVQGGVENAGPEEPAITISGIGIQECPVRIGHRRLLAGPVGFMHNALSVPVSNLEQQQYRPVRCSCRSL